MIHEWKVAWWLARAMVATELALTFHRIRCWVVSTCWPRCFSYKQPCYVNSSYTNLYTNHNCNHSIPVANNCLLQALLHSVGLWEHRNATPPSLQYIHSESYPNTYRYVFSLTGIRISFIKICVICKLNSTDHQQVLACILICWAEWGWVEGEVMGIYTAWIAETAIIVDTKKQ